MSFLIGQRQTLDYATRSEQTFQDKLREVTERGGSITEALNDPSFAEYGLAIQMTKFRTYDFNNRMQNFADSVTNGAQMDINV